MKKNKKRLSIATAGTVLVLGLSLTYLATQNNTPKRISDRNDSVVSLAKTKKNFYKGEVKNIAGDLKLANYPTNFQDLVATGEITILGTVQNLKSYVYAPYGEDGPANPYTMATIKVDQLLDGTAPGATVNVLFAGGNISQKELLVDVSQKEWLTEAERKDAQSDEVITVKESYSPLPQVGESMALILNQAPAGSNGIDEEYFMAAFSGKGIFLNNNGTFEREPELQPTGGGEDSNGVLRVRRSAAVQIPTDDEIMNKGMNELIQSKS